MNDRKYVFDDGGDAICQEGEVRLSERKKMKGQIDKHKLVG